ncbi:MAG: hypothetical protein PHE48_04045 [Candidatus Daviesbacteria bacterium]|nr:hypothetical protein [Candidatus Daviesbacteria bacterium]
MSSDKVEWKLCRVPASDSGNLHPTVAFDPTFADMPCNKVKMQEQYPPTNLYKMDFIPAEGCLLQRRGGVCPRGLPYRTYQELNSGKI